MLRGIVEWARDRLAEVSSRYGVNPIVYAAIVVANTPFFYYFLYRTVRALGRKQTGRALTFALISLLLFQSPAIYVAIFGHDLPWWAWSGVGVLAAWGIYAFIARLRRARTAPDAGPPEEAARKPWWNRRRR
jgi:hypothetical protein